MHELSIVMSIIKLAAEQADADMIEEIELDIGCLSGIDMDSFDFAWKQAIKQTVLENATRIVNRIPGKAHCLECGCYFDMQKLYDCCPECDNYFTEIISGKELKLRSLVVPD